MEREEEHARTRAGSCRRHGEVDGRAVGFGHRAPKQQLLGAKNFSTKFGQIPGTHLLKMTNMIKNTMPLVAEGLLTTLCSSQNGLLKIEV